jgi:hypothetical protein
MKTRMLLVAGLLAFSLGSARSDEPLPQINVSGSA